MNLIDKAFNYFAPVHATKRANARKILNAYESAKPSRTRRNPKDNRSGNAVIENTYATLRGQARHLDQNHDLARGVLNCLVNNVVGPKGIGVEFHPKNKNGEVNKEVADELQTLYKEWCKRPEVCGEHNWAKAQRLLARSWFRDGEVLTNNLMGAVPNLIHKSKVPFSIELLEGDYLADYNDTSKGIFQGVQRNEWGAINGYHFYKGHPSDTLAFNTVMKRVDANQVCHLKMTDRIRQNRGVSVFAAVMNRLNDLKDYEEAERVAARMSASMVAYIKKGSPDVYVDTDEDEDGYRTFPFAAGMTFDELRAGEEIGTVESNRPSALLQPFRDSMLKAIAAGTSVSYSTASKNYDGTYSSQRQELVEQWTNYAVLSDEFISMLFEPVIMSFIKMATMTGIMKLPKKLDLNSIYNVEYIPQAMPWIDPAKEAKAHETHLGLMIKSPQQIIRTMGGQPEAVLDQWEMWKSELNRRGLNNAESETVLSDQSDSKQPSNDSDL